MDIIYLASPQEVVASALEMGIPTISFTYNEPTSFYEYVYDIARLAKKKGLHILWHSNGGLNPDPLRELLKYTDAVTIDLKAFSQQFYEEQSKAKLKTVLQTLKIIHEQGVWLEIVNLIIPTLNDDPQEIRRMCTWIKDNLGTQVPLHFSRFHPAHRLTHLPPTPVETLEQAYTIARDTGIEYVTIGNVPGHRYNSTFCPQCGGVLLSRIHFQVLENRLQEGCCPDCGLRIPGVWTN
jgi:pyruvate formate lyase activating enzyme